MKETSSSTNIKTVLYVYHSHNKYLVINCFNLYSYQSIMFEGKLQYPTTRLQSARSQNANYKIMWGLFEIVQCDGCN